MRRVVRNETQVRKFCNDLLAGVQSVGAVIVDYTKYQPPHTLPQNSKMHAMIRELAEFTGYTEGEFKEFVKGLGFWPMTEMKVGQVSKMVPKSAAMKTDDPITRKEEFEIIERLYQIGATLPGFEWSDT